MENEVVKSVLNMNEEELKSLPVVSVRFIRRPIVDRKTNKVSGLVFNAEVLIHNLITPKMTITQAEFGLAMVLADQESGNQITLPSYANYSKGLRKEASSKTGEKATFYFAEYFVSKDLIIRLFFSDSQVTLLNALVKKGALKISFKIRPEEDVPTVQFGQEEIFVI